MALPTSRNTTYSPGQPVLSADLNSIQDWIVETYRRSEQNKLNLIARNINAADGDGTTANNCEAVAWLSGSSRWVAASSAAAPSYRIKTSTDATWQISTGTFPLNQTGSQRIAAGSSVVLIASAVTVATQNRYSYSSDGATFTLGSALGAIVTGCPSIGYNGSLFLMKPDPNVATTYSSADGASWTLKGSLATATHFWDRYAHSGSVMCGIGYPSVSNGVVHSTADGGTTWSTVTIPGTGVAIRSIIYDSASGLFFAAGQENSLPAIWTASNPAGTWTKLTLTSDGPVTMATIQSMVSYCGTYLINCGATQNWTSKDGLTWSYLPSFGVSSTTHRAGRTDGLEIVNYDGATTTAKVSPVVYL